MAGLSDDGSWMVHLTPYAGLLPVPRVKVLDLAADRAINGRGEWARRVVKDMLAGRCEKGMTPENTQKLWTRAVLHEYHQIVDGRGTYG